MGLDARRLGAHGPIRAHPPQVVAHQVDDHHMLGPVLLGAGELLSRRLARRGYAYTRPGPLNRLGPHLASAPAQEALGGQAHRPVHERAEARLGDG